MTKLATPEPEIPRDRWGRPLVTPPEGGDTVPYNRCTTYVDVLEDKYNLQKWMQRMVATGLSQRPDLVLSTSANTGDKRQLDKICEDAREAASGSAAATTGTALHALTERIDRGDKLGTVPDEYAGDLDAYKAATADLTMEHIEKFCVLDSLKIGGTPDRVVKVGGKRYIADIKTGSITYGIGKIAMQLAVYSRSKTYHPTSGERDEHRAEINRGIIIHLPAATGRCDLHWVDLLKGWEGVKLAKYVHAWRKHSFDHFTQPYNTTGLDLVGLIAMCSDRASIEALWQAHESEWTDDATAAAKSKLAEIETPSPATAA